MGKKILQKKNYGIIATNTTNNRKYFSKEMPEGGLSGAPLKDLSTHIIRKIYRLSEGRIPIIGCGGIMTFEDALSKIKAGASLLQIYTGFVYQGPLLMKHINTGLHEEVKKLKLHHYSELIGRDSK